MDIPGREKGIDNRAYSQTVKEALEGMLGVSGAQAVLFYLGEPDPESFDNKLRGLFGAGAEVILKEISSRLREPAKSP